MLTMVLLVFVAHMLLGRPPTETLLFSIALAVGSFAIPYVPFEGVFGFVPLPAMLLVAIVGITVAYVAATELQKKWFYRWARCGGEQEHPRNIRR